MPSTKVTRAVNTKEGGKVEGAAPAAEGVGVEVAAELRTVEGEAGVATVVVTVVVGMRVMVVGMRVMVVTTVVVMVVVGMRVTVGATVVVTVVVGGRVMAVAMEVMETTGRGETGMVAMAVVGAHTMAVAMEAVEETGMGETGVAEEEEVTTTTIFLKAVEGLAKAEEEGTVRARGLDQQV